MNAFTIKLKQTVSGFMTRSGATVPDGVFRFFLSSRKKDEYSNVSFTEKMIDNAPFVFTGTAQEQEQLKGIYLALIQTPEGKQNIERLIVAGCKITLRAVYQDKRYGASYNPWQNEMWINMNSDMDKMISMRHETDHALDFLTPEQQRADSVCLVFYADKMKELKARMNDILQADSNQMIEEYTTPGVRFYRKNLEKARQMLPETPEKEKMASEYARAQLAQAYWSGGKGVSDPALKDAISGWNDSYNEQAYGMVCGSLNARRCFMSSGEDFLERIQKIADEIGLPINATFLKDNVFLEIGEGHVLLEQNAVQKTTVCKPNGMLYLKTV